MDNIQIIGRPCHVVTQVLSAEGRTQPVKAQYNKKMPRAPDSIDQLMMLGTSMVLVGLPLRKRSR